MGESFKKLSRADHIFSFQRTISVSRIAKHSSRITENGDDRARTDNLRVANAALSQLSYVPEPATAGNPKF
jgi:hypothetical protein